MKIEKNKVVSIHYTLTDDQNNLIDTSRGGEPLVYLHGHGNIIPGLEAELEGRQLHETFQAVIEPEQGYGFYDENLVFQVDRSNFEDPDGIEVGMRVQSQLPDENEPIILEVVEIRGNDIILDGNHPLAGETLHFDIEVVELRDATEEEIAHGHVHGPFGHHH